MKRKKVSLGIFEEAVLPQLQAKHADVKELQKAIDEGYDIYEDGEDGKTVAVKFTVSVSAGADDSDDDETDEGEKEIEAPAKKGKKGEQTAQRTDDELAKLIGKSVAEAMA